MSSVAVTDDVKLVIVEDETDHVPRIANADALGQMDVITAVAALRHDRGTKGDLPLRYAHPYFMFASRYFTPAQVSTPVGLIWFAGRTKP